MTDRRAAPGTAESQEQAAHTICLRLLGQRARTRAELEAALARRGIDETVASRVLDRLAAVRLVDDADLAAGFAASQHRDRHLSAAAVAVKLRRRGVAEDAVAAAVAPITRSDEFEAARRVAEKHARGMAALPRDAATRRLLGVLARRGYLPEMSRAVVEQVLGQGATGEEAEDWS